MGEPKVLIVNRGHHLYNDARKFGELVFLTEGRINVFSSSNLQYEIETSIEKNATTDDYLLLSGHILPNAIAVHAMLKKFNKVKMLIWIGNIGEYKVISLFEGGT